MDSQSDNNKNINNNSVNTGSHKLGDKLSSSSKLYKYIITIDLCINYLFYAVNVYITGPTLLELKKIYGVEIDEISMINTIRAAAFTFGALNGFVFNYVNRQLLYTIFLSLTGATMICAPILPNLTFLKVNYMVDGFASGGLEAAADVWITEIWGNQCGPYVQMLHFIFAFGSILAPLIIKPFLGEQIDENNSKLNSSLPSNNENISFTSDNQTITLSPIQIEAYQTKIWIPYMIGGVMIICCAIVMLMIFCIKKYETPMQTIAKPCDDRETNSFIKAFVILKAQLWPNKSTFIIILCCTLIVGLFLGTEDTNFNYLPSFTSYIDIHFTDQEAATISTFYAISFTAGRAVCVWLAAKFKAHQILFINFILILIGDALMILFANSQKAIVWIATIILGFGFGPIYASMYSLIEENVKVSNVIGSLFLVSTGVTSSIFPEIVGRYIDTQPLILIWLGAVVISICSAILVFIYLYSKYNPPKNKVQQKEPKIIIYRL